MANYLTFRVDEVDGVTRESVCSFLTENVGCHVVCFEISDKTKKPHYQGWVRTDLSSQTFANRIKKRWPAVCSNQRGKSTGKYSAAPVRKESYASYILKGTPTELPDIVSKQLPPFEVLDVESLHRKWWSQHVSTAPKAVTIVEEGIEVFAHHVWHESQVHNRLEVAHWLSEKYKGKGKNSFLFKNYINGILSEVNPSYNQEFCRQLAEANYW